eukprot:TRINITY_DN5408_c1_g1_i1.p1 TRINITY_DN5408_c1_g1~~TRINITY_DN5408_c1_g1_i1.p1  ORF type:complete len:142 (-),score=11.04 TRINITY_DN5408_c1_g1_i1:261-686(-)
MTAGSLGSGGDIVINRNFNPVGCSVSTFNVRTIYTKTMANTQCNSLYTGSAAIMVTPSFRGRTGTEICAADAASTGKRTTCKGTAYMYLSEVNNVGYHGSKNVACGVQMCNWWPWGADWEPHSPSSLDSEWITDFLVVCCS